MKERIPWNKGKKTGLIPKSAFKKGQKAIHPFPKGNIPWNKGKPYYQLRAEKNPKWKGGRIFRPDGYWMKLEPSHPYANGRRYVREHRLIMEQYLGRILDRKEKIHHKNGIKTDNRIENLEVMSNAEHSRLHMKQRYAA